MEYGRTLSSKQGKRDRTWQVSRKPGPPKTVLHESVASQDVAQLFWGCDADSPVGPDVLNMFHAARRTVLWRRMQHRSVP